MGIKALFNKANPTYFSGIDKVNVIIAYILVAIFPILKPKRTASTLLNILEPDQFHIFDSTNVVPTYKDIYTRG